MYIHSPQLEYESRNDDIHECQQGRPNTQGIFIICSTSFFDFRREFVVVGFESLTKTDFIHNFKIQTRWESEMENVYIPIITCTNHP